MTTIDKRPWTVVTTKSDEANYCLGVFGSPFSSLPFRSLLLCLAIYGEQRHQIWGGALSIDTFDSAQLLINGIDPQLVCPFCLKTDGAPPSSTHACIFCNAPMHAWCGFCSSGKQEPGGGCCFRRICRPCIVGRQQETSGSAQQPSAMVQQPMLRTSACKRAKECIDISSEKDLCLAAKMVTKIQIINKQQVTKGVKTRKVEAKYSLKKQVQQYHKVTILCLHKWKLAQIKIAQIKNRRIKKTAEQFRSANAPTRTKRQRKAIPIEKQQKRL